MQEFPKWKYHREQPARIVNDPEQEAALGPGWADTPAAFAEPAPPVKAPAEAGHAPVGTGPVAEAEAVEQPKPAKPPKPPKQPKQPKA